MERIELIYQNVVAMGATSWQSYILDIPFCFFVIADLEACPACAKAPTLAKAPPLAKALAVAPTLSQSSTREVSMSFQLDSPKVTTIKCH